MSEKDLTLQNQINKIVSDKKSFQKNYKLYIEACSSTDQ